jgi:hypothetical protein
MQSTLASRIPPPRSAPKTPRAAMGLGMSCAPTEEASPPPLRCFRGIPFWLSARVVMVIGLPRPAPVECSLGYISGREGGMPNVDRGAHLAAAHSGEPYALPDPCDRTH